MRIIFKKLTILLLTLSSLMAYGFDVTGERINLSGKISSTSLTSTGGVIDVVSDNEKYGKTWLTYNVKLDNQIKDLFKEELQQLIMMAQEQALRDKVSGAEMAMSIPSIHWMMLAMEISTCVSQQ